MKVRIKFAKSGVMRFIGHLDVMRYFQKAIRRAGIDVAYSGGFSPHQIMSFAAPLGVGLTSNGEYMDIEVVSSASSGELKDSLNKAMVPGMEIISVTKLPDDAMNAMASVAAAEYIVRFREGYEPDFDWEEQVEVFYSRTSIPVTKKTKKSEIEMDIKPSIYALEAVKDKNGRGAIRMMVDASSSGNIKPGLVIEAFLTENGDTLSDFSLEITREDTFTNTGTEDCPVFIPLDTVGKEF